MIPCGNAERHYPMQACAMSRRMVLCWAWPIRKTGVFGLRGSDEMARC
jgi:hypothetical protein